MSTRKGNNSKKQQKYQNKTAFRNDMHETNKKQLQINSMLVSGVCGRCRDIIEWRKKFKKYKPIKAPKTCVKCQQKTVTRAYHTICTRCAQQLGVCEKCGQKEEIISKVEASSSEKAREDSELQQELKSMSERQRRTFFRRLEKGDGEPVGATSRTEGFLCSDEELDSDNDENSSTEDVMLNNELECSENVRAEVHVS